jgi:hypothetical protein
MLDCDCGCGNDVKIHQFIGPVRQELGENSHKEENHHGNWGKNVGTSNFLGVQSVNQLVASAIFGLEKR